MQLRRKINNRIDKRTIRFLYVRSFREGRNRNENIFDHSGEVEFYLDTTETERRIQVKISVYFFLLLNVLSTIVNSQNKTFFFFV